MKALVLAAVVAVSSVQAGILKGNPSNCSLLGDNIGVLYLWKEMGMEWPEVEKNLTQMMNEALGSPTAIIDADDVPYVLGVAKSVWDKTPPVGDAQFASEAAARAVQNCMMKKVKMV